MRDIHIYYQLAFVRAMFLLELTFKDISRYMLACTILESEKTDRHIDRTDAFIQFQFMYNAYWAFGHPIARGTATENPNWVKVVRVREMATKLKLSKTNVELDIASIVNTGALFAGLRATCPLVRNL